MAAPAIWLYAHRSMLRLAPALLLAVLLLPLGAGLAATLLPAFGYLPAIGGTQPGLQPWRDLLAWPGLAQSVALTVWTGLAATLASLLSALAIGVLARRSRVALLVRAATAPLLATPHAALAIGLAFLVAPSGWIARLVSPWLTGWVRPPNIATVQDPFGIALIAGLWLKETPYLLLMILAALGQADPVATLRQAASMGYGPWRAWGLAVLPRLWPQIRLPVMAVLAFSLSVVDVGLILGPSNPPTLAILVLRGFADPDFGKWFPAAAGAVLLALIVLAALLLQWALVRALAAVGQRVARRGERGGAGGESDLAAGGLGVVMMLAGALSLVVLAIWSVTGAWRFPDAWPSDWSVGTWRAQEGSLAGASVTTLWLGAAATVLALALTVLCLENERRSGHVPGGKALALLYLPLLVPQIAFLFGLQTALVWLRIDGGAGAMVWAHLVFVLPYVFLSLADPWRALDPRYARSAAGLGASPARVFFRITLPLLGRPLLAAGAVGFAVSAGLYLPTLFAGAGRFDTLTTRAVTFAGSADRRVLAATALLQALLPLLLYLLAGGLPAWLARNRRGLATGS